MTERGGRKSKSTRGRGSSKKRHEFQTHALNTTIVVLTIICLAFIASVVQRNFRDGSIVEDYNFTSSPPGLSIQDYQHSPLSTIEVEVLNGCGVKGLAQLMTDFLRSRQIDVVKTENATNFDYEKTLIIQRNQFIESSYKVADLLSIPRTDTTRVIFQPDLSLAADITLIVGKDYNQIAPLQDFLSTQP